MPIYEYICEDCGSRYERIVLSQASRSVSCPKCASSRAALQLYFQRPGEIGQRLERRRTHLKRLMRLRSRRLRQKLMRAMERLRMALLQVSGPLRQWLRGAAGDQAYESYLRHVQKISREPLTVKEFYRDHLQRKYSRPNRCC